MPEFLRFLRKTITENRPFTGGGSLFESKRGEEIGPTGDWDQNSASSSTKISTNCQNSNKTLSTCLHPSNPATKCEVRHFG